MEKQRRDRQNANESFWYQLRHLEILKPVAPEDFEFALRLGSAAATGQMPMKSPARRDVTFEMEPGGSRTIRFADTPFTRMWLAIRDHCGGDGNKFLAMFWRFDALLKVADTDQMKPWTRDSEDGWLLHPAMIEAAAVMPLDSTGDFEPAQFAERVAEIAKRVVCG